MEFVDGLVEELRDVSAGELLFGGSTPLAATVFGFAA